MIEIIAQGIVSDVHFANKTLTITLALPRRGKSLPAQITCTATGILAVRAQHHIAVGQNLVVRGDAVPTVETIVADSIMNLDLSSC